MPLINLLFALIIIGVVLWLINNYLPMDPPIKTLINVVIVITVLLWLLTTLSGIGGFYIGHPR